MASSEARSILRMERLPVTSMVMTPVFGLEGPREGAGRRPLLVEPLGPGAHQRLALGDVGHLREQHVLLQSRARKPR
jgi:hypothetical protein